MCCFYKVDKLVSKQYVIFDTPVKDCKTKDAITINIDVMLVFEIYEAKTFYYQIGPERFDDLLRAKQDEALRHIANETALEDAYDLHSQNTDEIVTSMNEQFAQFGVRVVSFAIQGVSMPPEMAKDLQDRTLFDAKDTMNRMKQEYDRLELNNSEGKAKLQEECSNKQMAAEQYAEVTKSKAIKETGMVVATTEKALAELRAQKEVEVNQMLAETDLQASEERAKILSMEREVWATTSAEVGALEAESESYVKQKAAEAEIQVAEKLANGKRALGDAEGSAAQAFAAKRMQEAELGRLNILDQLITNPELQIATSQENSLGLNNDNAAVASVTQQGLEALRAKLAEITTNSISKLQPRQQIMDSSRPLLGQLQR
jgi:regulator of protease activity HflC (stomatin/prohibitin superfamily)